MRRCVTPRLPQGIGGSVGSRVPTRVFELNLNQRRCRGHAPTCGRRRCVASHPGHPARAATVPTRRPPRASQSRSACRRRLRSPRCPSRRQDPGAPPGCDCGCAAAAAAPPLRLEGRGHPCPPLHQRPPRGAPPAAIPPAQARSAPGGASGGGGGGGGARGWGCAPPPGASRRGPSLLRPLRLPPHCCWQPPGHWVQSQGGEKGR